jgi:excisionase family DNA binding protein
VKAQRKTYLTVREQAETMGISWRHLQNLTRQRLVPHIRLGRLVRYCPEDVDRAIREKLTVKTV